MFFIENKFPIKRIIISNKKNFKKIGSSKKFKKK